MAVALAAGVVVTVGCSDDDDSAAGTYRVQADAVFCTDLVSARDTVISGVVDATGGVSPEGVAAFAASYEPILRDHIAALQSLDGSERDAADGVVDAASAVADRLRAVAGDPASASAATAAELRSLATSPALVDQLTAAGLRTC